MVKGCTSAVQAIVLYLAPLMRDIVRRHGKATEDQMEDAWVWRFRLSMSMLSWKPHPVKAPAYAEQALSTRFVVHTACLLQSLRVIHQQYPKEVEEDH